MSTALPAWLPDRTAVTEKLSSAVVVGVVWYVLNRSPIYAVAVAAVFFAVQLLAELAEATVGDYADHVVFGLLLGGFVGYNASVGSPVWVVAPGALLGGWFLLDGVQNLRHGVTRDEVEIKYTYEGSMAIGLPKALLVRLAQPFLL
ncbi:hypothetical protein [Haloarcula brevis]|uniref:hypothetical protein n=1 Tax=Haloarcula brevis TaxID=3111453 RepID=UPI00300F5508